MIRLKNITQQDLETAAELIRQGQQHLKEQGIDQWQNGYPNKDTLKQDAASQTGYFIMEGAQILGYLCIIFDGEPAYHEIDGSWNCNGAYAVIHRITLSDAARGHGYSTAVFRLAEELCRMKKVCDLRIDTHADNRKMQHVLEKNGFAYRGIVSYESGKRMAYEKMI